VVATIPVFMCNNQVLIRLTISCSNWKLTLNVIPRSDYFWLTSLHYVNIVYINASVEWYEMWYQCNFSFLELSVLSMCLAMKYAPFQNHVHSWASYYLHTLMYEVCMLFFVFVYLTVDVLCCAINEVCSFLYLTVDVGCCFNTRYTRSIDVLRNFVICTDRNQCIFTSVVCWFCNVIAIR
jgi:hypothetical protein